MPASAQCYMDGRYMGNSTVESGSSGARNGIRTDACYKQYFQFASLDTTGASSAEEVCPCYGDGLRRHHATSHSNLSTVTETRVYFGVAWEKFKISDA